MGIRTDNDLQFIDAFGKRIAQSHPSGAVNTTVFTLSAGIVVAVKNVVMCNTTSASLQARIFVIPNGQTAGSQCAIFYDYTVPENTTWNKSVYVILDTAGDQLAVWSSVQGITFTISGVSLSSND